jgi:hypothetical protein
MALGISLPERTKNFGKNLEQKNLMNIRLTDINNSQRVCIE